MKQENPFLFRLMKQILQNTILSALFLVVILVLVHAPAAGQVAEKVEGMIVVKLATSTVGRGVDDRNELTESVLQSETEVISAGLAFPEKANTQGRGVSKSVLSSIYKVQLQEGVNEEAYINHLKTFSNVVYAEPYYQFKPLYVPNDPQAAVGAAQSYLAQIKAYQAWDVTQGDPSIVIGILDTGVDPDHQDLVGNLVINEAEILDGIDNDGDGYIDNRFGYDFADDDGDPSADLDPHGVRVTGLAAATTNNGIGIAGTGFNSSYMPLKIFRSSDNASRNSYEAIVYAADKGCQVINLSWGRIGAKSGFAQDIINYAVLERDAVVIAAAGNTTGEYNFYPASYDNVLSVAFVDGADQKSVSATHSDFVDITAPGISIYSTTNNDQYNRDSGSSYAAPMVAGAAALVRATHPEWSALQVMEQLRVSADNIYDVANNADYRYKLGKGRLNMFKAVTDEAYPAVRMSDMTYSNGIEEAAYFGDTLTIASTFTNYLTAVENVNITLTSESPYVEILQGQFFAASMDNMSTVSNTNSPFKVVLSEDLPENEQLTFRLIFEGDNYSDYQAFDILSSASQQVFEFGNWRFGITATGNIGQSKENPYSSYRVSYDEQELIKHTGVLLSNGVDVISENAVLNPDISAYTNDFVTVERLKRYKYSQAGLDVRSAFEESSEKAGQLGIRVKQRLLGWDTEAMDSLLVMEYILENRSTSDYDSLYFSLLNDWSIGNGLSDKLTYDPSTNLAYAYNESLQLYVGMAIFDSNTDSVFCALDIQSGNGNTNDLVNDTISDAQKISYIIREFEPSEAGVEGAGNNVLSFQGVKLRTFQQGSALTLQVAIVAGSDLSVLQAGVEKAREAFAVYKASPPLGLRVPVCEGDSPQIYADSDTKWVIYENALSETAALETTLYEPGIIHQDTAIYYAVKDAQGFLSIRQKMEIYIAKPTADFMMASDTVMMSPSEPVKVYFEDNSDIATSWKWDFGNQYGATVANPITTYSQEGVYEVSLITGSSVGCFDTVRKNLVVVMRAAAPSLTEKTICIGNSLILEDESIDTLQVFADEALNQKIFEGKTFVNGSLERDTVFYAVNADGLYHSVPTKIRVNVIKLEAVVSVMANTKTIRKEPGLALSRSSFADQIEWKSGDNLIGTGDSLFFNPATLANQTLEMVAISNSGCEDIVSVEFSEISSSPAIKNSLLACKGNALSVEPVNTEIAQFYADEQLQNLLKTGSSYYISQLNENDTIYVVNIDQIYPSEPEEVILFASEIFGDFEMSTDTLNLAIDNSVTFTAIDQTASQWNWQYGDGATGEGQVVSHVYQEPGVYTISLAASDSVGCSGRASKKLVVLNTRVLNNREDIKSLVSIFPNPAEEHVKLDYPSDFHFEKVQIIDSQGKIVKEESFQNLEDSSGVINLDDLQQGNYFVRFRSSAGNLSFPLIKQ